MRMSGGAAEDTLRDANRKQQGRKCRALGVANRNIIGMRAAVLFVGDFGCIPKKVRCRPEFRGGDHVQLATALKTLGRTRN